MNVSKTNKEETPQTPTNIQLQFNAHGGLASLNINDMSISLDQESQAPSIHIENVVDK